MAQFPMTEQQDIFAQQDFWKDFGKPQAEDSGSYWDTIGSNAPSIGGVVGAGINLATGYFGNKVRNKQIKDMRGELNLAKGRYEQRAAVTESNIAGRSSDILNRFAMERDPAKTQGFSMAFDQNVRALDSSRNRTASTLAKFDEQIAGLQTQKYSFGQGLQDITKGFISGFDLAGSMQDSYASRQGRDKAREALYNLGDEGLGYMSNYFGGNV